MKHCSALKRCPHQATAEPLPSQRVRKPLKASLLKTVSQLAHVASSLRPYLINKAAGTLCPGERAPAKCVGGGAVGESERVTIISC